MHAHPPVDHAPRSATLVGRSHELRMLDDQISRCIAGSGSLLLISGEAGIGKSRLIAEARNRFLAASGGAATLL